jgi:hypothetical protein
MPFISQLPLAAPQLVRQQSSTAVLRDAIGAMCDQAAAAIAPSVVQAIRILLKRAMLDASSVKRAVLRQYLVRVQSIADSSANANAGADAAVRDDKFLATAASAAPFDCAVCAAHFDHSALVVASKASDAGGKRASLAESAPVILPCCGHTVCRACFQAAVVRAVQLERPIDIPCPTAVCDGGTLEAATIQQHLYPEQLQQYFAATLRSFIAADETIVQCPNTKCHAAIGVMTPQNLSTRLSSLSGSSSSSVSVASAASAASVVPPNQVDEDGNVLRAVAWQHYQAHRIRCFDCGTNFCAECQVWVGSRGSVSKLDFAALFQTACVR